MRHYCSYFDSLYTPRGLIMIGSLLQHHADAVIHVLCLDSDCFAILSALSPTLPRVMLIALGDIEAHDPGLAAHRLKWGASDHFQPYAACLSAYVIARNPDIADLTYLHADLYFYQSPELVFAQIGAASVAITPHRFAPANLREARRGIFNTGWITWRNDETGRQCLADYRRDCLSLEGGRFADQTLLDRWPQRYPDVKILELKGLDLALWNVDNYDVHVAPGGMLSVDDQPLICFHFESVEIAGQNQFSAPSFSTFQVSRSPDLLISALYQPYLNLLDETSRQLSAATGLSFYGVRPKPAGLGVPGNPTLAAVIASAGLAQSRLLKVGDGLDFDHAAARESVAADSQTLPYEDRAVDIVVIGTVNDMSGMAAEAHRVVRQLCIFCLTAGSDQAEAELRLLLARHGFEIQSAWSEDTGLAPRKLFLCRPFDLTPFPGPALLNIGCGGSRHPAWLNVDIAPGHAAVFDWNIRTPFPLPGETFDAVYHSHVLEHLPKNEAPGFISECFRLLKPGGILRVAIPDLEAICRVYLHQVERASAGDPLAAERYDWIILELLDQTVRNRPGGAMIDFFRRNPLPAESFILERIGAEGRGLIQALRGTPTRQEPDPPAEAIGRFRLSGEIHQWMYDRFSLSRLIATAGFEAVTVTGADGSAISGFNAYGLDVEPGGAVRKPDSLFMEARRPNDAVLQLPARS